MEWKYDHLLPLTLSPTDAAPLINLIFHELYRKVSSNLKAVADRGWHPANRKLLKQPSPLDDSTTPKPNPTIARETDRPGTSSTITLNIHDGMGATVLDRMIAERVRSSGAKQVADKRKRRDKGWC